MNGRLLAAILAAVMLLLTCGCSNPNEKPAQTASAPSEAAPAAETRPLDVSAVASEGGYVFASTAEDYVSCCNGLYRRETGSDYLTPPSEWTSSSFPGTAHFGGDVSFIRFTEDAEMWTLPDIRIFTRPGDNRIAELTVGYDDHGSSEGMYSLYRDMCCRTLRTFLPDMSAEHADELFSSMFVETDDLITTINFIDSTRPPVLYYSGSVGVYPYFAYGENVLICFIPVNQERLDTFAAAGTELRSLDAG